MILENSCCGLNFESPHSEINILLVGTLTFLNVNCRNYLGYFPSVNTFDNIPKTHAEVLRMWLYLENGLHVWADESGGIRHQVTQHAGTLLFVSAHTAMFQLSQDLDNVLLHWTVPSLALFNCITTDTFITDVWQNN